MKPIPMLDLKREYEYLKDGIDRAVQKCFMHQQWILGPEVKELEDKVAAYIGVRNCIGAASGTDALVLSLRALAIQLKGEEYFDRADKIITTPFTFVATADAILRSGATPVFIDIEPNTFNISSSLLSTYLKNKPSNIRGIIPVHLYGYPCNMDDIMRLVTENNLFILEDAAQAFGGSWQGKKLGSIGTMGAFSFFPSKNVGGCGDGGMVATDNDKLAETVRMLLKHGGKDRYNVDHIGYNSRLDTIQAAILLEKLVYVDSFNQKRIAVADFYYKKLAGNKLFKLPQYSSQHSYGVYNQFTIRVLDNKRDLVQSSLKNSSVSTAIYYPLPLHVMKVFHGRSEVPFSLAESERAAREVLSLPIDPFLNPEEIEYICKILNSV